MNPNSQKDNFIFSFPRNFIPQELEDKWMIHLKNYRKPFPTVLDYVNSNIKDITLPALSLPTVEQKKFYGKARNFRSSLSPYDLSSREFNVNLRNTDHNIFYFLLEDVIYNHYIINGVPFFDNFTLSILDNLRREILKITLSEILITGFSEIKLSNSEKEVDEQIINLSFIYNYKNIEYMMKYDENLNSGEIYDEYSTTIIKNDDRIPTTPPNNLLDQNGDIIGS